MYTYAALDEHKLEWVSHTTSQVREHAQRLTAFLLDIKHVNFVFVMLSIHHTVYAARSVSQG